MPTVRRSVIVPHSAQAMFDLVDHCENYPDFLPWCADAEVMSRTARTTRGRLDIDFRGLKTRIVSVNHKQRPREIRMVLEEGPFEEFEGRWAFKALGEKGCRVELEATYSFANGALQAVAAPVFGFIVESLVDRFVERADAVAK